MEIIQAAVETEGVHGALRRAMVAQPPDRLFDIVAIGDEGAAVPKCAEVFLDDETGANRITQLSLLKAISVGIDGLRVIFHHPELMLLGDPADRLHVRAV